MNDENLDTDEQTTLPANEFTRDSYTFAGWATSTDGSVEYDDEAGFTMGTEDVTLYAVWEELTVGDRGPAGGYIFYDDEEGYDFDDNGTIASDEKDLLDDTNDGNVTGDRYLEAAPYGWHEEGEDPEIQWGDNSHSVTGTSTEFGTGKNNTAKIVAIYQNTQTYAANACDDYWVPIDDGSNDRYEDWYLPSKDELDLMYKNLHSQGKGDFSTVNYWSSSESNIYKAHTQNFRNGFQSDLYKESYNYSVRPVRRFAF